MVLFAGVLGKQILLSALPNMPALQRISVLRDHWVAVTSNTKHRTENFSAFTTRGNKTIHSFLRGKEFI